MGQCSLGDDSDYDHDYTQLVTPERDKLVSDEQKDWHMMNKT
jgi:hypothetical protein